MIKKLLFISVFIFSVTGKFFAQTDNNNIISEYTAKISKGNIQLNWKVINPKNVFSIKLYNKKVQDLSYQFLSELDINNFYKKSFNDSSEIFLYSYKYKPEENGVYNIKIELTDISVKILNSSELKIGFSEAKEFKLYQNRPNPFNPTTIISYDIYTATFVSIKIFDLSGKEVDNLVEEFQQAGTYEIEFNASKYNNFSSGIYFYKLQTNYNTDIKKMIYAK
jgi:hypothetical protein